MVDLRNCIAALILLVTLAGSSALQAEWPEDGISICNHGSSLYDPRIIPDGAGGCIAVWEDYRTTADIYAQRLDSYGTPLWAANGLAV